MTTSEKVIEIIEDQLVWGEHREVLLATTLVGDLGADSLDIVELVMELEDEFDIDIPDAATGNETDGTVQQVVDYVEAAVKAKEVSCGDS